MKYLKMCCENLYLIIGLLLWILIFSDNMSFWGHPYLQKTANDCFFFFQETFVYAKITASTCFENWFTESWWIVRIADLIILVMWLLTLITLAKFKTDVTSQVHFAGMAITHKSFNFKSQLKNRWRYSVFPHRCS